jgi:hypothetical protein
MNPFMVTKVQYSLEDLGFRRKKCGKILSECKKGGVLLELSFFL